MKLKDILEKKVIYVRDTNCQYYWDYKYIVEIDDNNYTLINHSGSGSGWEPLGIESVEVGFASAFIRESEYENPFIKCIKDKLDVYDTLGSYLGDCKDEDNGEDYTLIDIILVDKETIEDLLNKKEVE